VDKIKKILSFILASLIVFDLAGCVPRRYIIPPKQLPPPRKIENINVALALGGGGSKGFVHLGVLEVLEDNGIPIDLIVGTSAGSIIGALYANYADAKVLKDNIITLHKWDVLDFSLYDSMHFFIDVRGPIQGYYLEEFLVKNLTVNNIEDLKIPFVAVATDLHTSKSIALSSGPIPTAVHASSAIPAVFSPVQEYGMFLVDGGVIEPVPVETARSYGPKVLIAVDISNPGKDLPLYNMLDVFNRSLYLSYYELSRYQRSSADIIIHPDLDKYDIFEDEFSNELYELGRTETIKKLPEIRKMLKEKGIKLLPPSFSLN